MKLPTPRLVFRDGHRYYLIEYTIAGKRHYKYFKTPTEAREFQVELRTQLIQYGTAFDRVLSRQDRGEILTILQEMDQAGVTLGTVWADYKHRASYQTATCRVAWDHFLETKRKQNLRDTTLESYRRLLPFLESRWDQVVSSIRADDITEWIDAKQCAPRSVTKYLSLFREFLRHCKDQGWCVDNAAEPIKPPKADAPIPKCLSNDDVKLLLNDDDAQLKPYLVLALYGGLRQQEISRLDWDDLQLNQSLVVLNGHQTKTRSRRVVALLGQAATRLGQLNQQGLPLYPHHWRPRQRRLIERTKIKWHRDCLRHTAATHMVNVFESEDKAALNLGNTAHVVRTHYRGLATPEQTNEFLQLLA